VQAGAPSRVRPGAANCGWRSRERRAAAERLAVVHTVSLFFSFFSKLNSAKFVVILVHINLDVNLVGIDFANKVVNMCDEFSR
jgi:hypothetical protein